jgi:hypothetical protein
MARLTLDISMSLDGFIAGPNRTVEQPLGEGGVARRSPASRTGSSPRSPGLGEAAGDKDVVVAGGANVVQQCLNAGLLDQMQIHLVPVFLGEGVRLFDQLGDNTRDLEVDRAIHSPAVTHVRYRLVN